MGQFLGFMGGHSCYEGNIELMGGSPQSPPLEKTLEGDQNFCAVEDEIDDNG